MSKMASTSQKRKSQMMPVLVTEDKIKYRNRYVHIECILIYIYLLELASQYLTVCEVIVTGQRL